MLELFELTDEHLRQALRAPPRFDGAARHWEILDRSRPGTVLIRMHCTRETAEHVLRNLETVCAIKAALKDERETAE